MPTLSQLQQALNTRNVKAFLDTIAYGEGANYNTYYGGGKFDPNGPHPCRKVTAGRWTSTAAGRYQFLCDTWRGLSSRFGFTTMSPANQDLGALALISDKGGLTPILNGDLATAIQKVKGTWPSLPTGSQQTRTWAQASSFYARAGGTLGPSSLPPDVAVVPSTGAQSPSVMVASANTGILPPDGSGGSSGLLAAVLGVAVVAFLLD